METRRCPKCGETKPLAEFSKNAGKKDGLGGWCRRCANKASRETKARNRNQDPEALPSADSLKLCASCGEEKPRREFPNDKDAYDGKLFRCKACNSAYKKASTDANRRRSVDELPPDHWPRRCPACQETKTLADFYVDLAAQDGRYGYCKLCTCKLARLNDATRRAAKAQTGGTRTRKEWERLLESTRNCCVRCGDAGQLCGDHVVPISKGGHSWISNIQPLCSACNLRKGNRNSNDYRAAELVEELRNYVAKTYGYEEV